MGKPIYAFIEGDTKKVNVGISLTARYHLDSIQWMADSVVQLGNLYGVNSFYWAA